MMMMLPHQVREVLLERTLNPEDAQRSPALDPARAPAQPPGGPSVLSNTPRCPVRWGGADYPGA